MVFMYCNWNYLSTLYQHKKYFILNHVNNCAHFWKFLTLIRCNGNPVREHLLTDTYDACLNQCKSHSSECSWITYDEKTKFCQLFEECDPPNLKRKLIQKDWHVLASERDCPSEPDCYFKGKCQVYSLHIYQI